MLDHSDEELHGPVEELVLKRFLLEVDHEALDFKVAYFLHPCFPLSHLTIVFTIFSLCFFSTLTIPITGVNSLCCFTQLSLVFFWSPLTIIHRKWTYIALWVCWNFIFIANRMRSWYLRHRLRALLEDCFCCCIFDFSQLLHPLLLLGHWICRVGLM